MVKYYVLNNYIKQNKKNSCKDEVNLKINKSLLNTQLNTQRYSITKL